MAKRKPDTAYRSGLIAAARVPGEPVPPFRGAGWRATLEIQDKCPGGTWVGDKECPNREVVIYARSWLTAQRALNLIGCAIVVMEGGPLLWNPKSFIAHNRSEPAWLTGKRREGVEGQHVETAGIPVACSMAAKASRRRSWTYSLTKVSFSVSLFGVDVVDLEPHRSPHFPISPFPSDHIRFAHAIVCAYSVLEDLGLELRASQQNPSTINGQWNPKVLSDLQSRLVDGGVDLCEKVIWTLRGPPTRIQKARPIKSIGRSLWSAGKVRDCEVAVVDAIAYASWLRSYVASHAVKDLTKVLSPYDVVNVQHLARRLLLQCLGYWG